MMRQTEILESLNQLPDSLQEEVIHYIKLLKARHAQSEPETPKKRGALGVLKGNFKMADDFDAPLEDLKDYM